VSSVGFGERAKRFAMIVDDLKVCTAPSLVPHSSQTDLVVCLQVTYLGVESGPGVGPSGIEAVQAKL